jgi:hypothetical protein
LQALLEEETARLGEEGEDPDAESGDGGAEAEGGFPGAEEGGEEAQVGGEVLEGGGWGKVLGVFVWRAGIRALPGAATAEAVACGEVVLEDGREEYGSGLEVW